MSTTLSPVNLFRVLKPDEHQRLFEHSIQGGLSDNEKQGQCRRRNSGSVDESLCPFEHFRFSAAF